MRGSPGFLVWLTGALLASGCIAPESQLPPDPAGAVLDKLLVSDERVYGAAKYSLDVEDRGVGTAEEHSVMHARLSGPADSWFLVHMPFREDFERASFTFEYAAQHVSPAASGSRLVVLPHLVRDDGNGGHVDPTLVRLHDLREAPLASRAPLGSPLDEQAAFASSLHGAGAVDVSEDNYEVGYPEGFLFAYAATVPWSMEVKFRVQGPSPFDAADVRGGENLAVARYSGAPVAATSATPAGQVEGTHVVPSSGWTHVGIPAGVTPHAGRHQLELHFPNGMDAVGMRYSAAWDAADVHAGTWVDTAGDLVYNAEWFDAGTTGDLLVYHMPWEHAAYDAGGLALTYCARVLC